MYKFIICSCPGLTRRLSLFVSSRNSLDWGCNVRVVTVVVSLVWRRCEINTYSPDLHRKLVICYMFDIILQRIISGLWHKKSWRSFLQEYITLITSWMRHQRTVDSVHMPEQRVIVCALTNPSGHPQICVELLQCIETKYTDLFNKFYLSCSSTVLCFLSIHDQEKQVR